MIKIKIEINLEREIFMQKITKIVWTLILISLVLIGCAKEKPETLESADNSSTIKNEEFKEGKITYENAKFGYQIDYPKEWGEPTESDNGDGFVLLGDSMYDIRVYGSYLMENSFEDYLKTNYDGWSFSETELVGAEEAYSLDYTDEESHKTAIVGYKNGTLYTLLTVRTYTDQKYDISKSEDIEDALVKIQDSFQIF